MHIHKRVTALQNLLGRSWILLDSLPPISSIKPQGSHKRSNIRPIVILFSTYLSHLFPLHMYLYPLSDSAIQSSFPTYPLILHSSSNI